MRRFRKYVMVTALTGALAFGGIGIGVTGAAATSRSEVAAIPDSHPSTAAAPLSLKKAKRVSKKKAKRYAKKYAKRYTNQYFDQDLATRTLIADIRAADAPDPDKDAQVAALEAEYQKCRSTVTKRVTNRAYKKAKKQRSNRRASKTAKKYAKKDAKRYVKSCLDDAETAARGWLAGVSTGTTTTTTRSSSSGGGSGGSGSGGSGTTTTKPKTTTTTMHSTTTTTKPAPPGCHYDPYPVVVCA